MNLYQEQLRQQRLPNPAAFRVKDAERRAKKVKRLRDRRRAKFGATP